MLDLDLSGPTLDVALGINSQVKMDKKTVTYYPVQAEGLSVMGLGLLIDRDRLLIWSGEQRFNAVRELYTRTKWDEKTDFLVIDMPPSSAEELKILLAEIKPDVCVLVTTPSKLAYADYIRVKTVLTFFKIKFLTAVNMSYDKDMQPMFDGFYPDEDYLQIPFDPNSAVKFSLDVRNVVNRILELSKT